MTSTRPLQIRMLSGAILLALLPVGLRRAGADGHQHGDWIHAARELGPRAHLSKIPVVWQTECRQPEGKGLTLDGIDQRYEDSRPHTRVLVDGNWRNIYPELRKTNILQTFCDRANELKIKLMRARARTRHVWFKGLTAEAERKRLNAEAVPPFRRFAAAFEKLVADLKGLKDLPEYEGAQVAFTLRHFASAGELLKTAEGFAGEVLTAGHINAMQRAQVAIEIGADALDAEPTPRVLSTPAYDAKTGLHVLFGGDHFDFLMNDTWVFDPAKKKWYQRHPASAPPPRGKHVMEAAGDGTIRMHDGYYYHGPRSRYAWIGSDVWTYDVEKNAWTGPEKAQAQPPDTRTYWGGAEHPSYFLQGPKPDAAAHAKLLAALPVNTWVRLKPPHLPTGHRDWGTVALDTDRDLIVFWNGGHSCYCSSDAPHYHLDTNRWELAYPAEIPLGMVGASGSAVSGYSFNHQHWITNHTWAHYLYDPKLKRVLVVGSMSNWQFKFDPYFYLYDPLLGEWATRHRKTDGLEATLPGAIAVARTPRGTVAYTGGSRYYLLDYDAMRFRPVPTKGQLTRRAAADWFGMVYDPSRDRLMGISRGGQQPYDGKRIDFVDMKTGTVSALTPENPETIGRGPKYIREWRYIPDLDLCLICDGIMVEQNGRLVPGSDMAAYDPAANRWVVLRVHGKASYGWSIGFRYDAKRKLLWGVDGRGNVFVLKLDLKTAVAAALSR